MMKNNHDASCVTEQHGNKFSLDGNVVQQVKQFLQGERHDNYRKSG